MVLPSTKSDGYGNTAPDEGKDQADGLPVLKDGLPVLKDGLPVQKDGLPVLNIAAYRFVAIHDRERLRDQWLEQCLALSIKGTILIAPEGINLFLAGPAASIETWLESLQGDQRFAGLEAKYSWSQHQGFARMRVRLKAEIIRMNKPDIAPAAGRAPWVSAQTLARWLDQGHDDEGRALVMLDTRNAFEVDYGTFNGAVSYDLKQFSDFPKAIQMHRQAFEGKTVVSFCTGGIRCEKAGLFMQAIGMKHCYQLDGGILKYFETVGQRHYQGSCFVFDQREALDPALKALSD
ncbi:MAG: sulfurtransferase [Betaproteobacteria bacterium]|nr:sulfurtransferase [Pseudomonadota bacterium]NBQ77602.1 sulfurtransferase [Betaproteobacteria bacterium]NBQ93928.1 sulfurtransferase [Betaproteobacteria bacterium]NBS38331.1 sulfurtransferase [Betaproteobacteria bacterium]NBT70477.1 sulfurtransferase [Betaproteobacteria bacterium]